MDVSFQQTAAQTVSFSKSLRAHPQQQLSMRSAPLQQPALPVPTEFSSHVFGPISMLARTSLKDVRHLRSLLTRLLNKVAPPPNPQEEEDSGAGNVDDVGRPPSCLGESGTLNLVPTATTKPVTVLSDVVNQILQTIDEVKICVMRLKQTGKKFEDQYKNGALTPIHVVSALDQLDFPVPDQSGDQPLRRVDWLVGRNEACQWTWRTNYRAEAIQKSLSSCGRFLRSSRFAPLASVPALEDALMQTSEQYRGLTFVMLEQTSRNPILYTKIGDVMHCLVAFGNMYPEQIIIRGLDESHCIPSYQALPSRQYGQKSSSNPPKLSSTMSDLLCGGVSAAEGHLLPDLATLQPPPPANRASARCPSIRLSVLDLTTPSRHVTFRKVTEAARCAVGHYCQDLSHPDLIRLFFDWLHSYVNLFTGICINCGELLGQDASLPVLRSFTTPPRPHHEHCRAI